jgi:hypothetical protein
MRQYFQEVSDDEDSSDPAAEPAQEMIPSLDQRPGEQVAFCHIFNIGLVFFLDYSFVSFLRGEI